MSVPFIQTTSTTSSSAMHNFNTLLVTFINQGAGYWLQLDRFFVLLTSFVTDIVLILVPVYFCILAFRTPDVRERLREFGRIGELLLSVGIVYMIVKALKVLVAYPRPFESLADITALIHAIPLESFPSMHAALTMAVAIAVLPYRKHLAHLLIAFSLIVSLSRLYVGVHYPFDIGIGLLIGFFISKLIHRIFSPRPAKKAIAQIGKKA